MEEHPIEAEAGCCFCFFAHRRLRLLTEPLQPDTRVDDVLRSSSAGTQAIRVLDEVVTTERAYAADLESLQTLMLVAMPNEEVHAVVAPLVRVHQELLQQLIDAGTSLSAVASCFGAIAPYLRMYSVYCASYPQTLERLAQLRIADADTLASLEEAHGGERLESLLIKPVQRLCKYPLLLASLLSALPEEYARREELTRVEQAIRAVNSEVNHKVRGAEEAARLMELDAELSHKPASVGSLVRPGRRLLLEVELRSSRRQQQPVPQPAVAVLGVAAAAATAWRAMPYSQRPAG